MVITDTLNGHTVEDVRRNIDGSVSLYCASGRVLTLYVEAGVITAKAPDIAIHNVQLRFIPETSTRLNLLAAFQGYMVNYVYHDDTGNLVFVLEPKRHNREKYTKSSGHREIRVTHHNGLVEELPPVSAKVNLPSLAVLGKRGM